MKPSVVVRRFLPRIIVIAICRLKFGSHVSAKAEVELGKNLKRGPGTIIGPFTKIKAANESPNLSRDVDIASNVVISVQQGGIDISDGTVIGPYAAIVSANYRYDDLTCPLYEQERISKGMRIRQNVTIGPACRPFVP